MGATLQNPEVDGQTRLVGVIGWPVAHSLSPVMHNAALRRMGLNWQYVALPVHPRGVGNAIHGAGALGFRGVNVTVPHKQAVMALMDAVAPEAAAVGAVNTVVMTRDAGGGVTLEGHNTDVDGFLGSLRTGGFEPAGGGKSVVIGAGGAARAVVHGLLRAGMEEIVVLNRTVRHAQALVADLQRSSASRRTVAHPSRVRVGALTPGGLRAETQGAALLVNATTVGMWPKGDGSVWPDELPMPVHLTVYDLVYNPLETRLLCQARDSGLRAIDGLGMLARQGALALALWLDAPVDVEATTTEMRRVCMAALEVRWQRSVDEIVE
jgi:shikimate dehydrogenase